MMKTKLLILISAGMFATAGAYAQTTAPAQNPPESTGETPMVAPPAAPSPQAPVEGENSFTESQTKERMEAAGYADVQALNLGADGIWQAKAKKDGADVNVRMDYQGNITSELQ